MHVHRGPAREMTPPAFGTTRLDRRRFLRRAAVGLAIPAALAVAGLPTGRTRAQSVAATPATTTVATPEPPAEGGYAPVNGLDLYYEIRGTSPGGIPPLILLHGGFGTIGDFGQLLPTLAQTRQVIAVELQAHGHTADIDRPLRFELMADDVAALIAHLGLEHADLFGFSLGGGVALQTAIRRPELVRTLVVASAPYRRDGWHPEILAAMSSMNAEAAEAMAGTPMHAVYVSTAPNPDDWPALVAKLGQLLGQDYDLTEGVRSITAPTLLVFGDSDSVRLEHAVELFRLLGGGVPGDLVGLPRSRLAVLPGTAHFGLLSRPDLLLPIVTPFLDAPMP